MVEQTLLAAAAFSVVSATLFIYVGRHILGRPASSEARQALLLFGLWWLALGASSLVGATQTLLAAFGVTTLALHTMITYLSLLIICVALWGLLYYLSYLLVGTRRMFVPLTAFYVAYYAFLVYLVTAAGPVGVNVGQWTVTLEYAEPLADTGIATFAVALLVIPQILGALAYFSTYFRLRDPAARYRVALVSWSIVVWFGSALVGSVGGLGDQAWWPVASRLIGLTAALVILLAYRPPNWIRRQWGGPPSASDAG